MKRTCYLILIAIIYCSCVKEVRNDENITPAEISTDKQSVGLASGSNASASFLVKYDERWNLSIQQTGNWLQSDISGGSGNATVTINVTSANLGTAARTATIKISPVEHPSQSINIVVDQEPNIIKPWSSMNGGSGVDSWKDVAQTPEGYFVAVGYSTSSNDSLINRGKEDVLVSKFNPDGSLIWQKSFGGSEWEFAYSVVITPDSNYLVAATTASVDGDVTSPYGAISGWLLKLDHNGEILWQKTYGSMFGSRIFDLVRDKTGGYLLVGTQLFHGWLSKIDETGNVVWEKTYGQTTTDLPAAGFQDADGNFIITGSTVQVSNGDVWVFKIDGAGNVVWDKSFNGGNVEEGWGVTETKDGGYMIAGDARTADMSVQPIHVDYDVWILKLNNSGDLVWQKRYGSTADDKAYSIVPSENGKGYVVAGLSAGNDEQVFGSHGGGDAWLMTIDELGNLNWQRPCGGSGTDAASAIIYAGSGRYLIAGSSTSNNRDAVGALGNTDAWLFIGEPIEY